MKILLTGKNGQVGFELQRALAPIGTVHAVDSGDCDLADAQALRALIRSVRPDLIVNPAAYTAVDRAEDGPEGRVATAVNATAPGLMAEEAAQLGAAIIHYSTDYVFDGHKPAPYVESDPTSPLGAYGRSKRDGEVALIQHNPRHLVLRTSWVVGAHGHNFAKTMLRLAAERKELNVVNDQVGAPTSAALIADLTAHLAHRIRLDAAFPFGLYHMSAGGETSWYDYARFVIDQAIKAGKPLALSAAEIRPIATAEYPTRARRPMNSRLDTRLFVDTFDLRLPHWQAGLDHILQQIL